MNRILEATENALNSKSLHTKFDVAFRKRRRIIADGTTAFRLINSTGDGIPGLFIDVYGEYAVCQFEKSTVSNLKDIVVSWLVSRLKLKGIIEKSNSWLAEENNVANNGKLFGDLPNLFPCTERGIKLLVDPNMSKTGFFIDFRDVRTFIESQANNATILNCFSFTCSVGLFALRGGARRIVHVEKRPEPLELGKEVHELNGFRKDSVQYILNNVWEFMEEVASQKEKFDIVVLDPPEYIVKSTNEQVRKAKELYFRLNRLGYKLVRPDRGILITSCCSHGFSNQHFKKIISEVKRDDPCNSEVLLEAGLPEDHPISPVDPYLEYFKVIVIRKLSC